MKTSLVLLAVSLGAFFLPETSRAQVNSGSNGSDGAFNPTSNLVVDMADHPDGIYQYTSVNIPAGVDISFKRNSGNRPVVWLVQNDCIINGQIFIYGESPGSGKYIGGPGGGDGGNGGNNPGPGSGPGGGAIMDTTSGCASYATLGAGTLPGAIYGNKYILPLQGGSGGGGDSRIGPGGGGGGAILIAANKQILFNGLIGAWGGWGANGGQYGGCGSGGSVRFVSSTISGTGTIKALGDNQNSTTQFPGGSGRIRFDTFQSSFSGQILGEFTQGFQPIILPAPGQGIQLGIQSVGGVAVASSPTGVLANPDVIVPAQQTNPVSVVVKCTNVPLNSEITVVVQPANGASVQAVGLNNSGNLASSTATVSLNMPRGGGIIYAKCVTGIAGTASTDSGSATRSLAETGWTADGERFKAMEITAQLGGRQSITYIAESGKRYPLN